MFQSQSFSMVCCLSEADFCKKYNIIENCTKYKTHRRGGLNSFMTSTKVQNLNANTSKINVIIFICLFILLF